MLRRVMTGSFASHLTYSTRYPHHSMSCNFDHWIGESNDLDEATVQHLKELTKVILLHLHHLIVIVVLGEYCRAIEGSTLLGLTNTTQAKARTDVSNPSCLIRALVLSAASRKATPSHGGVIVVLQECCKSGTRSLPKTFLVSALEPNR
jgi:hypothetical protein